MSKPYLNVLEVTRVFAAPRDLIFRLWTEEAHLARWMCPFPHWGLQVSIDARPGGSYRFIMTDPGNGNDSIVFGMFRVVEPPQRLVYTWQWETTSGFPETLVTVDFHEEAAGRTRVTITHEGLPSEDSWQSHTKGWNGCLDRLPPLFL